MVMFDECVVGGGERELIRVFVYKKESVTQQFVFSGTHFRLHTKNTWFVHVLIKGTEDPW